MGLNVSQKLEIDLLLPHQLWDVVDEQENPELIAALLRAAFYGGYRYGTEESKAGNAHDLTRVLVASGAFTE